MNVRNRVVAVFLPMALLATGCAGSVAGQPEVAAAALTSGFYVAGTSTPAADPSTAAGDFPTDQTDAGPAPDTVTAPTTAGNSPPQDTGSDTSVSPTTIPGLSADCNKVLTAITAFSSVLQSIAAGTSGDTISQADVDDALHQLPTSGLPTRPQADVNILRATIKGAAGKTVTGLALSLSDGKVVEALQDLSSWATANCR